MKNSIQFLNRNDLKAAFIFSPTSNWFESEIPKPKINFVCFCLTDFSVSCCFNKFQFLLSGHLLFARSRWLSIGLNRVTKICSTNWEKTIGWFFSQQGVSQVKYLGVSLQLATWLVVAWLHLCLRPSAKDQGITWVVVVLFLFAVVVQLLVNFLIWRNIIENEKYMGEAGN